MKLISNLIATTLLVVMPMATPVSASAQTFNNGGKACSVEELGVKNGGSFTIHGNTATTTVEVKGPANCKETVSLASWNTAYGSNSFRPLETQRYVTGVTYRNLGVGKHNLSVYVDNSCNFQADIVLGSNPKGSRNNANYGPELMGYTQVAAGVCQAPAAATTPSTPAPAAAAATTVSICSGDTLNLNDGVASQGGNCSTNTTVVETPSSTPAPTPTPTPTPTPAAVVKPAATAAQPTALVNTGPGNTLALFALATIAGYFIHRKMVRKALA